MNLAKDISWWVDNTRANYIIQIPAMVQFNTQAEESTDKPPTTHEHNKLQKDDFIIHNILRSSMPLAPHAQIHYYDKKIPTLQICSDRNCYALFCHAVKNIIQRLAETNNLHEPEKINIRAKIFRTEQKILSLLPQLKIVRNKKIKKLD